jgi:hypothetical protein
MSETQVTTPRQQASHALARSATEIGALTVVVAIMLFISFVITLVMMYM